MNVAPTFGEDNSFDIVAQRLLHTDAGRLPQVLVSVIDHLHQIVRETRPTPAEWREAVGFLTDVGHASDEKRQEWVLLADLLGLSALVEDISTKRPKGATPNTLRGPFYRPDAPHLPNGATICLDGAGEPMTVRGRVADLAGRPIDGATVETWQANHLGIYENQQPDQQPEFNLRGAFTTDADGSFGYTTVKPAGYVVPDDGPAGRLLKAVGCPLRRPAHLHFLIRAAGFETITTHVFERGEAAILPDPLFGVRPDLLADIAGEPREDGTTVWALDFAFVMVPANLAHPAVTKKTDA